jgi:hypothetical protein
MAAVLAFTRAFRAGHRTLAFLALGHVDREIHAALRALQRHTLRAELAYYRSQYSKKTA